MDTDTKDVSYPKEWLRGIPNDTMVDEDGIPNSGLFQFETNPERKDSNKEVSINWFDCPDALNILMNQPKGDNSFQFKLGAACFDTEMLHRVCLNSRVIHKLDFERREVPGNIYHGNILLNDSVSSKKKAMIISYLIMHSFLGVIPRTDSKT